MQRIIKKVIKNNSNNQLVITIPKNSPFHEGDFIELIKVPEPKKNANGEYEWNTPKPPKSKPTETEE